MKHLEKSLLAGQTVKIKASVKHPQNNEFGGSDFRVEDWWDRVNGESWAFSTGNPACIIYAIRIAGQKIPLDDEVLYGKVGYFGHLVHVSEIEDACPQQDKI